MEMGVAAASFRSKSCFLDTYAKVQFNCTLGLELGYGYMNVLGNKAVKSNGLASTCTT